MNPLIVQDSLLFLRYWRPDKFSLKKAKLSACCSFPVTYLYDGDIEYYLNGAITWRLNRCCLYEPTLCYSQYGIQFLVRHRVLMLRERCSIMQKRYNAICCFPDEILAQLVWQCKVFLLTHQRCILGSVRSY